MQTRSNNPPTKCVWKVGVLRADKGSREKAPKGSVSGNAGIRSPEFPVADAMSRPHCSLRDLWCPFQVLFNFGVLLCS